MKSELILLSKFRAVARILIGGVYSHQSHIHVLPDMFLYN